MIIKQKLIKKGSLDDVICIFLSIFFRRLLCNGLEIPKVLEYFWKKEKKIRFAILKIKIAKTKIHENYSFIFTSTHVHFGAVQQYVSNFLSPFLWHFIFKNTYMFFNTLNCEMNYKKVSFKA